MTDENVNPSEETQDETVTDVAPQEASAETTDAPDGVADVENVPDEAAPEGEPAAEPEPPETEPATAEPADAEPADAPDEVGDGPAAEAVEVAEEMPVPDADEAIEEEAAAEEASAPSEEPSEVESDPVAAAVSEPKKKKKRLPRALRPPRTKTKRERPAERKAITRLPKPEHSRGR
ncbi:MAG: hypothetical protein H0U30_07135, partial [Actinobacteria bacterium]|nr:hypothetical protein [Actinomycetota bacterium]